MDGMTKSVAPPADAESDHESASMMTEDQEQEPEDGAMKVDSVNIRPAENGGFIVSSSKSPVKPPKDGGMGPMYSGKDYAFGSLDEVVAYLQSEFTR